MELDSGGISLKFPEVPQNHMKDDIYNESILSTEAKGGKNVSPGRDRQSKGAAGHCSGHPC